MACRYIIRTEFLGTFEEGVELDLPVAQDIRIRSASFLIFIEHVVDHPLPIFLAQVYKIKRDAYLSRDKFSDKAILLPLAVSMQGSRCIMPVLHEKCKYIIALLLEHKSSDTGIDTT